MDFKDLSAELAERMGALCSELYDGEISYCLLDNSRCRITFSDGGETALEVLTVSLGPVVEGHQLLKAEYEGRVLFCSPSPKMLLALLAT